MECAYKVKELLPSCQIAFLTGMKEYAVEAFSLNAIHYLVKPIEEASLRELLERFIKRTGNSRKELVLMDRYAKESFRFRLTDVIKIQSRNRGVDIYTHQKLPQWIPVSFSGAEQQLDQENFLRVNRGVLINENEIAYMGTDFCRLYNGEEYLLSRRGKAEIHAKYNDFLFQKMKENY